MSLLLLLARPTSPADRRRAGLIALATALAGGLLLAAVRIARYGGLESFGGSAGGFESFGPAASPQLAQYVTDPGLRPGTTFAVALLVVPVLAFAAQALRLGSAARDRRMAALRLAGATPRTARLVAATEAGGAAGLGGLAAGPVYLVLWLLAGELPDPGLVPRPTVLDLLLWPLLALVLALAGAAAGAAVERRALTDPLGTERRRPAPAPVRTHAAAVVAGLIVAAAFWGPVDDANPGELAIFGFLAGAGLVALAGGLFVVLGSARLLLSRGGALALLAGSRLLADPRGPGRVAGVLLLCGIALGIDAALTGSFLADEGSTDRGFYFGGFALAGVATAVAAAIAVATLAVGATDHLLDARRPYAALSAQGLGTATLTRVLTLQLASVAVPTLVLGALLGGVAMLLVPEGGTWQALALVLLAVPLAAGAGLVAAWLVARALRGQVVAATAPEHLRVA